jgi:pantetheine-phosphate adenylyltransferase
MKTAVYPGSFDPPTKGHIDVIERAARFFDHLYVLVAESYDKNPMFLAEERKKMLETALPESVLSKVEVVVWSGLTVNFVKEKEVDGIIRGVRSTVDFRDEQTLANINSKLYKNCETLLFCCRPEYRDVSSRIVKEVAKHGGALDEFVPDYVKQKLLEKYQG